MLKIITISILGIAVLAMIFIAAVGINLTLSEIFENEKEENEMNRVAYKGYKPVKTDLVLDKPDRVEFAPKKTDMEQQLADIQNEVEQLRQELEAQDK